MSKQSILERERRWALPVAAISVLPLVLYVAALLIERNSGLEVGGLLPEQLRSADANRDPLLFATIARGFGFLAMIPALIYLFKAAQARSERVQSVLMGFAVIGPVVLAAQGVISWIAQTDIASKFVERSPGVGDVYNLAEDLIDASSSRSVASGLLFAGALALIFALVYTPLWAVRTGLLTRFFGTFGMALGASLLFILQIALLAILIWFAYLGLVIAGRSPSGRPPAWDAAEAIPWPKPGDEQLAAAGAGGGEIVNGDASEIPGIESNPNQARRDRAKRRKRKRRR